MCAYSMRVKRKEVVQFHPKELKTGICTPIFTGLLFTVAKSGKPPKCPATDERRNKMCSVHRILFSLKKEVLAHAATWIELEDTTLSEISQSEEDQYCMIPFI